VLYRVIGDGLLILVNELLLSRYVIEPTDILLILSDGGKILQEDNLKYFGYPRAFIFNKSASSIQEFSNKLPETKGKSLEEIEEILSK
jgi:hypothetical protein